MPGSRRQRLPRQAGGSGQADVDDAGVVADMSQTPKASPVAPETDDIDDIEIDAFIQALLRRYGYDFTGYAPASLRRRVLALPNAFQVANLGELIPRKI